MFPTYIYAFWLDDLFTMDTTQTSLEVLKFSIFMKNPRLPRDIKQHCVNIKDSTVAEWLPYPSCILCCNRRGDRLLARKAHLKKVTDLINLFFIWNWWFSDKTWALDCLMKVMSLTVFCVQLCDVHCSIDERTHCFMRFLRSACKTIYILVYHTLFLPLSSLGPRPTGSD